MPAKTPHATGLGRPPEPRRLVLPLSVLLALTLVGAAHPASALPEASPDLTAAPSPPPPHDIPSKGDDDRSAFRLGAMAGVGFPRPLSFEAFARLGGYVGVGAEYGLLPTVTLDGVYASTWAASLDLRVFPFHGAFFLAARAGYQHLDAGASVSVSGVGSASASADLDTWFINPRLGFLWQMPYALTIAIEAGVQIPVTTSFSTTLPTSVASEVRTSAPVATLSGVLPTVDLLRIGLLF